MIRPLFFVGNAAAGTITSFTTSGQKLHQLASTVVGVGCSTFAVLGELIFVATKAPEIVVCRINPASAELEIVGRRALTEPLAYLSVTSDGKKLLGASYHGGWATAWPIDGEHVGEELSRVAYRNLHCIIPAHDGPWAYGVSLGQDLVVQCRFTDSGLEVVEEVPVASGAGARHVTLSADGRCLYLMTEFTGDAIRFDRDPDTGKLSLAEKVSAVDPESGLGVSRFGADPRAEHLIWGADLHLTGNILLCSERSASTVAAIALDASGQLGEVLAISPVVEQPRGFVVSPDGTRAVVASERTGEVGLYAIDPASGKLTELDRTLSGDGANWVRFVN